MLGASMLAWRRVRTWDLQRAALNLLNMQRWLLRALGMSLSLVGGKAASEVIRCKGTFFVEAFPKLCGGS